MLAARQVPAPALRHAGGAGASRNAGGRRASVVAPRASAAAAVPTTGIGSCHGGAFLSADEKAHLEKIAALIGTPGKGITACDEGPGTIGQRFEAGPHSLLRFPASLPSAQLDPRIPSVGSGTRRDNRRQTATNG